jgi:hypothetical protein
MARGKKRRIAPRRQVAFRQGTVAREDLPFPMVLYPGFYGTFFAFRKTEDAVITLCSCAREAIENYVHMRLSERIRRHDDPTMEFVLDSGQFPLSLVQSLMESGVESDERVLEHLQFEDRLCHECKGVVPEYRYCHEMYGGLFKQNYGWYVNKQGYEFGVDGSWGRLISGRCSEKCPGEILELTKQIGVIFDTLKLADPLGDEALRLRAELAKRRTQIWSILENEVRAKLGYEPVGEEWTGETTVFYIVKSLFPDATVLRHYRPDFLEGMELDIFIQELRVGIEYQGVQHFEPVEHWGGVEALKQLQVRDEKKKRLCQSLGIRLVYLRYDEDLDKASISAKLGTLPHLVIQGGRNQQ